MKEKQLIIVGAGDLGREIFYSAIENKTTDKSGGITPSYFIDENERKVGTVLEGIEVLSFHQLKNVFESGTVFILSVSDPIDRRKIYETLLKFIPNAIFKNVIHKSVVIMPNVIIGHGVFIAPNSTVAINTKIGNHTVINQNCSVGHDCVISDHSILSPGSILSGNTNIGKGVFLGSGVITYPGISIADGCSISSGVVVSRNIKYKSKHILKPNTMILPG